MALSESRRHVYNVLACCIKGFDSIKTAVKTFLISNFRRVLNVACFLLGNSPAPEFYMPTFWNTLSHLHRRVGTRLWRWDRFLVNDQRDAQILFFVFISIYNSLHVSSTSCSSSGETNCINTASGNCHSWHVIKHINKFVHHVGHLSRTIYCERPIYLPISFGILSELLLSIM